MAVIRTFGTWQVTDDGMNSTEPYEYNLNIDDLFAVRQEGSKEVWDFPIHLTEKTWLTGANAHHMDSFNEAFRFAQQHFAKHKPSRANNVDDACTWRLQKLMR